MLFSSHKHKNYHFLYETSGFCKQALSCQRPRLVGKLKNHSRSRKQLYIPTTAKYHPGDPIRQKHKKNQSSCQARKITNRRTSDIYI